MNPCKEESTFLITRKFLAKFLIKSSVDSFGETRSSSPNNERSSFSLFFVSGVKNLSIGYLFLRLSILETLQKQIYYICPYLFYKKSKNSFPYTETEDQLTSLREIKGDMQSSKVMDRLLCGDVGYGKTEVALRASFKAVVSGKQVAFIAPTTILSQQHHNTALSRMKEFGVNVEVLNRFKTPKQVSLILNKLKRLPK